MPDVFDGLDISTVGTTPAHPVTYKDIKAAKLQLQMMEVGDILLNLDRIAIDASGRRWYYELDGSWTLC